MSSPSLAVLDAGKIFRRGHREDEIAKEFENEGVVHEDMAEQTYPDGEHKRDEAVQRRRRGIKACNWNTWISYTTRRPHFRLSSSYNRIRRGADEWPSCVPESGGFATPDPTHLHSVVL